MEDEGHTLPTYCISVTSAAKHGNQWKNPSPKGFAAFDVSFARKPMENTKGFATFDVSFARKPMENTKDSETLCVFHWFQKDTLGVTLRSARKRLNQRRRHWAFPLVSAQTKHRRLRNPWCFPLVSAQTIFYSVGPGVLCLFFGW